jgi:large subunit ribosomal protein LP1
LVAASGVKVEAYWPKLFAKALSGKDISSFFNFAGVAAGPAPAATTAAPEKKDDKKKEEKKPEVKKEAPPPPPKEEEEDMDMGGLFD